MANYKVPSQAASGADTFSDSLVGGQITTGSDQMTGANFAIDRAIPEKDSKNFITEPFSDFVTLDDITQESSTSTTPNSSSSTNDDDTIKFNNDKNNADRSLYGSLRQRLRVAVSDIILKYPAAVYVDGTSPSRTTPYTAESAVYSIEDNTTEFMVEYSLIYNPFDVVLIEPESNILPETDNKIRNFFSAFTKYVVEINDVTYGIETYVEPDSNNMLTLTVTGNPFGGTTGSTENYIIRPSNGVVEGFYKSLDSLQTVLLNRYSDPIFNAGFDVPRDTNGGYGSEIITIYVNWPISRDGWNIQIEGNDFGYYVDKLSSIGEEIDGYKSNLIVRFLTAPQLYEFDTEEHKIEAINQIYGQSFDEIKEFIDNIAYMRNVSYDGVNNIPNFLLKNLCETLGLSSVSLFDEKTLEQSLYTRYNTQYDGISTGTNLIEGEYEFYRRLLVNLSYLYKSKGTRNAIEFFLKFIGAPEPMIRLDEYVYYVTNTLPSKDVEADISAAMLGTWVSNIAEYKVGPPERYELLQFTGSTSLTREEYPVDETTGLPRAIVDPTGDMFFQKGAGWYRKTLEHRSPDILDTANSDLTSRVKVIKTMSKPFTYGEEYFDLYRQLPGLDYGYSLASQINNIKSEVIESETEADLTLNRKNINVFLSADRTIDYDIYRKSRDVPTSFGSLTPQTGVTFAEFLDTILNEVIANSNMMKYDKFYTGLTEVYYAYQNSTEFIPYRYVTVEEFINRLSPYWVNIIEQFIPATTLWIGGNVIENGTFNRSKFQHIRPPWFDVDVAQCDFAGTVVIIDCPAATPTPTPTPTITPTPTSPGQLYKVEPQWYGLSSQACADGSALTNNIYLPPQYANPIEASYSGSNTFYEDAGLTITWTPSSGNNWTKVQKFGDSTYYAVNIDYSDYIYDAIDCSVLPSPSVTPTITPTRTPTPTPTPTPSLPVGAVTMSPAYGYTFTNFTNSIGGAVSWPPSIQGYPTPFTFPVSSETARTWTDSNELLSSQYFRMTLGGTYSGPSNPCISVYIDFGDGQYRLCNNTYGTTLSTGTPISVHMYPWVYWSHKVKFTIDSGCSGTELGLFVIHDRSFLFGNAYNVTNVTGTGLPSIIYPITARYTKANSHTNTIPAQTILMTLVGTGTVYITVYQGGYYGTPITVTSSGTYFVPIPASGPGDTMTITIDD